MDQSGKSCFDFFFFNSTFGVEMPFSQKCRFSTRTIVLCSCRQLSSCFISAPRSASWNILSQFKFTPCNPALRATVRSNIRPIFAYREKYICKKVSHEFISRSAKKKWKRDERKRRKIVLKRRNLLKIILSWIIRNCSRIVFHWCTLHIKSSKNCKKKRKRNE